MSEPGRGTHTQPPGSKKHSIDDIIDHMTADLQSYEGQYILLGSPPNPQHVWSEYAGQPGQQIPVRNPVFVQQPFDIQERKIQDFPTQHGLFYPNPPRVRDGSGEMIGMVDVGGGNFVNVVFNPNSPTNQIHQYISAQNIHHPDPNIGYIHYQQSTPSPPLQQQLPQHQNPTGHRDYGLFNNNERSSQGNHQLIENLVGNWLPNQSGTYSPFGNVVQSQSEVKEDDGITVRANQNLQGRKPRMVAQVRPMRPSYSDVLAKSAPPFSPPPTSVKPVGNNNTIFKTESRKPNGNTKNGKGNIQTNNKHVTASNLKRQLSSGSEGGGGFGVGGVRRWISLDELSPPQTNEEQSFVDYETYNDESVGSGSEYGLRSENITETKKEKRQKKKANKQSTSEEKCEALNNHTVSGGNRGGSKRPLHINNNLQSKVPASEKNVTKNSGKNARPPQEDTKKGGCSNNVNGGNSRGVVSEEKVPSVSRISRSGGGGNSSSSGGKRSQRTTKRRDGPMWFGVLCKRWQEQVSFYAVGFLTWFLHLIWDVSAMSVRLLFYLCALSGETSLIWLTWLKVKLNSLVRLLCGESWFKRTPPPTKPPEPVLPGGLTNNISLPATGDEAMKRLLACKGKDPYSILGVTGHCTDDDIKKYYKRQAVLVHPDKNSQPGAEEAFKILVHAFELIGEPERRSAYDRCVAETHQVEQAWSELSELLTQLHHKMEYAANTIRCTNCGKRHKRVVMQRPCYAARFCAQCKIHHSAREGDIWAESWLLGFLWHYYACMEGAVYDITEWAACQADNLKHLKANTHAVQYRIVLGKQSANYRNKENYSEPDLEEFLNNLYAQSGTSNGNSSANDTSTNRQRRKGKRKK